MKFIISTKNIKLTENLKQYIEERIGSCEKYIHTDLPLIGKVEIERSAHHAKGKVFIASINIQLKDKFLRAETTREDIYLAINELRDHLKIECRKYKEINIESHRKFKK